MLQDLKQVMLHVANKDVLLTICLAHGLALQALRDSFADGKAPALGVVLNFSPCHPLTSQLGRSRRR